MIEATHGTLKYREQGQVLFATIDAPPLNMVGPELVSDLVDLIKVLDKGEPYKVIVFSSANKDFFIAHVDTTKVKEYRQAAAALTGEASIAMLFRRLSRTKAVTIAQIAGRCRGAGSEFAMACDLRFGARETAVMSQNEAAFGLLPGGGATQYLTRLLGRGRALEVLLTANDYSADLAEHYGWINRSVPQDQLADFVAAMAERIARFPARGLQEVKNRVNTLTLSSADDFLYDSDAFGNGLQAPEVQAAIQGAVAKGFGTSVSAELNLGALLGDEQ